ncbi:MAG: flagellar basal body rod protein FlgB [Desulfatibacillum sp.]|nr:flagellar basal body rod protein FlgB [Desulfatibacillum sp.]
MPDSKIMGKTISDLVRSLDITRKRQGLISGNLANIETPDYHTQDIDFRQSLEQAMKGGQKRLSQTHARHFNVMEGSNPEIKTSDKAGVDIDKEMANLAENNLMYRSGVESLLRKFALIKYAISEGGK